MLKRARASPGMRLTVGVADVDRGEFEVRWIEVVGAVVERRRHQRAHQLDQAAHRIVGELRIGDVALLAGDHQHAVERAAPADLDRVADRRRIARLAEDAVVEVFAALGRPFEQLHRAVDRDAFLVAGDQERDRALRLAAVGREIIEAAAIAQATRALHVDRAAAIERVADDLAGERRMRPFRFVARRHHVGVAGEDEVRARGADAGVEILDRRGAGLLEGDAVDGEAGAPQRRLDQAERTAFRRRDRAAAQEVAGKQHRVRRGIRHAG